MANISILGTGWLGLPLGKRLAAAGHSVGGSTTTPAKVDRLRSAGIVPYLIDLQDPQVVLPEAFRQAEILIITVPPSAFQRGGRRSTTPPDGRYRAALVRVAQSFSHLKGIVYTSSTSAYGEVEGEVHELSPAAPVTTSAQMVVGVENGLRAAFPAQTTVVRLGGLIGGDRDPARYFAGRSGVPHPGTPVNLVHREDVIGVVERVLEKEAWGELFNVVAPTHPTREVHYTARVRALGLPEPRFAAQGSIGKRVSSQKVRTELGYTFVYPDPQYFPLPSSET